MEKTRTGNQTLMQPDPEIERTLHKTRRALQDQNLSPFKKALKIATTSAELKIQPSDLANLLRESDEEAEGSSSQEGDDQVPELPEVEMAVVEEPRTLRQLTAPNLSTTPSCIILPTPQEYPSGVEVNINQ